MAAAGVRRERNAQKSREDILSAAEKHFAEKGFYGARIDEIADAACINKRMLYEYFGNKEMLYKHVLFSVYKRMETAERKLIEQQLTGVALIRGLITLYFDFLRDNESFVSILMWENLNRAQALGEMPPTDVERPTIRFFTDEIRRGKEAGIFREDVDEKQVTISLITVCFANFSNRFTLSKLFGEDLCGVEMLEQRKRNTVDIMLTYLCRK